MIYDIAADLTALVHLAFIAFVLFGAVLGRRHRRMRALHLAAMAYGVLIEVFYWYCPLTYVEQWLRAKAGKGLYEEAFIQHYLNKLIYLDVSQRTLIVAAALVLGINVGLYVMWYRNASRTGGAARRDYLRQRLS